jgi:hypothetical protein
MLVARRSMLVARRSMLVARRSSRQRARERLDAHGEWRE